MEQHSSLAEAYFDIDEQDLQALYCPGFYDKGEQLCLDILDHHDSGSQPALLFLTLNLAAQDAESEALDMVETLENSFLFKALANLPFGQGTEAEGSLYGEILRCAEQRGLSAELSTFLEKGFYLDSGFEGPLFDELTF